MPGFTIHLACGTEYLKKHPREIKDRKKFLDGCIAPDLTDDKIKTHYRVCAATCEIDFVQYLKEHNIQDDFQKGYFFHLICDEFFYGNYFSKEERRRAKDNGSYYNDYDALNSKIIKKYRLNYFPKGSRMEIHEDLTLKYLSMRKVEKFIKKVSGKSLKNYQNCIKKHNHLSKRK